MGVDYIKTPSGILKVVQILMVIIAFSVFRGTPGYFGGLGLDDANVFGGGVLVTALIITPILLAVKLLHENQPKNFLEVIVNFLLGLLLLAAGSEAINTWSGVDTFPKNRDASLATGCFCLFASFAYFGNAALNVLELRSAGDGSGQ
ncbi:protein snakeskin-like [Penaeus vannamei]|uniref:protein snakeskin-like n=1 Tax=Penaeus vannamei TaxID=6689 RepID=UPI00387F6699